MEIGDFTRTRTLKTFHKKIVEFQELHHGEDYCAVHDAIQLSLVDGGKRYAELGINQGATLAAANLMGLKSSYGVDISLEQFEPYRSIFEKVDHDFEVVESSSVKPEIIRDCDVLYIDTVHNWAYTKLELERWSSHVDETIIFHDTFKKRGLRNGIDKWIAQNDEWRLVEHNELNVGYSVIERK